MLEELNIFNWIALRRAKEQIDRLKQEVKKETEKDFDYEAGMINILNVEILFFNFFSKEKRKRLKGLFNKFLKMQIYSLYAAGFLNEGAEKLRKHKWRTIKSLISLMRRKGDQRTKDFADLSEKHLQNVEDMILEIKKESKINMKKDFDAMVDVALNYLKEELEFSRRFEAKNYKYISSYIQKQFSFDPILSDITFRRITVIADFYLKYFYKLFMKNDPLEEKYPEASMRQYMKLMSFVLQEGDDDMIDLGVNIESSWKGETIGHDILGYKPTPIILRILRNRSVTVGVTATKELVLYYLFKASTIPLPPVFKIISRRFKKKIIRNFNTAYSHVELLEVMIDKQFGGFLKYQKK